MIGCRIDLAIANSVMIAAVLLGPTRAAQAAGAEPTEPATSAAQLTARARLGRADVPRIELAARLKAAGLQATYDYAVMRDNAARELKGRPDGIGAVSVAELRNADDAIGRQIAILQGTGQPPRTLAEIAQLPGRPQIPDLKIVYLNPLGDPADANRWRNILAHQTEGAPGSARASALAQAANPTKRGVTVWVETDGTAYWATSERAIPTHGDGANRNDNKFIDNSKTFHTVIKTNTIGVEFIGNYPDVTKPVTQEQMQAWLVLVRFLQERYGIAAENIYAHNWIDYKDSRYCEGCDLATAAQSLGYVPGGSRDAR
jgi:N-acetylmuramoyl-L-alanine amidase-like protein